MLAKKDRLNRSSFSQYFKAGKRFHSQYGTLIYTPSTTFHASVVVSKKVHKRAVVRNKLRRRCYGVLYTQLKLKNIPGVYILVLKQPLITLTQKQQTEAISTLIELTLKSTYNNPHV